MLGQVVRHTGHLVHRLLQLALALVLLIVAAGGMLAWRLAQGPLELGWLTRRLEAAANGDGTPPVLSIRSAALAWEGFTRGVEYPIDIRLTGLALHGADGHAIAEVPRAQLYLSAGWLMLGQLLPVALELDGVRLRVGRGEDGNVTVDLGRLAEDGADWQSAAAGSGVLPGLIHELASPVRDSGVSWPSPLAQLRRVRIREATLVVADRSLGATWQATHVELDVVRRQQGGATADAQLTLGLGDQRVQATGSATLLAGGDTAAVRASLTPIVPARLAELAPGLAPLRVLDAPVTLSATAEVGDDLVPRHAKLQAQVGEGRLLLGKGTMPIVSALADVEGSMSSALLQVQRLELAPRPDGPRTVVRGSVQASRVDGRIEASIGAELDQAAFADLAALWPAGVGGPGTRPWITQNITAGMARNGRVELRLVAPEDFSDAQVTALAGGIEGSDVTVHWMRPVPPIEHASGRLSFLTPDELEITVTGGREAGGTRGGIALQSGRVNITGITGHDQFITIDTDLAGPVADLIAVLKHPRLKLLDRRPMDLRDPSGTASGRLTITHMPLKDDIPVDDLHILATGRLVRLHLSGLVVGRDLDQGALDFEARNDGLKVRGTGLLGGIPSQLQMDLDFRPGGPAEITEKASATAAPTSRQLQAAGLDPTNMFEDGLVSVEAGLQTRRDGRGEVTVRADLGSAALQVPRLNFHKPAGRRATGEVHIQLDREHVTAIDRIRIDGDGISVAGRIGFNAGAPQVLQLERFRLGELNDASGELRFPQRPGDPWAATLAGHSLDASAEFGHSNAAPRPAPSAGNTGEPPWSIDAHFDRVVLGGDGRVLMGVVAKAESDGRIIRRGTLTGQSGAGAPFRLDITPGRNSRTLYGSADDAGSLLGALDLVEDMRGGRLSILGTYDDSLPGHPLEGTAEIADFRMRNAPGLAKLLQAMTLYGLVEVMEGPGLGFNRLIAPFRLSNDVLELSDARAFSASLGMTVKGRVDLNQHTMAMEGTIVPAYFFNTLLGEIPLIGRLFSPERGGGLFAATYGMRGPFNDPTVTVNPLAALTPGFLRGVFGIFDSLPSGPSLPNSPQSGGAQN